MCCRAWSGEAGGAGSAASGAAGKRVPWDQPILDAMHNHVPSQLGLVPVVPGIARGGDEGEGGYSQRVFIAQEPQPDEGTIGLGRSLSLSQTRKARPKRQSANNSALVI